MIESIIIAVFAFGAGVWCVNFMHADSGKDQLICFGMSVFALLVSAFYVVSN